MHPKTKWISAIQLSITLTALSVLQACGGGSSSMGANSALTFSGTVVDGPIEGAEVFLDLNGNLTHDTNEPLASPTDALGRFSFDVSGITSAEWAMATVVTHIPDTAKDADDAGLTLAQAGKSGFSLMAPASAFVDVTAETKPPVTAAFVSPLTTLVAQEMLFNKLPLAEARRKVKEDYRLALDPMASFLDDNTSTNSSDSTAKTDAASKAVKVAVALGEAKKSALESRNGDNAPTLSETLSVVATSVSLVMPEALASNTDNTQTVTQITAKSASIATQRGQAASSQEFQNYVVVFKSSVGNPSDEAQTAVAGRGGQVKFTYTNAVKGFAVSLPAAAAEAFLEAMGNNPNVDYVETDLVMQKQATQSVAPWGLDRIDQTALPLDNTYNYNSTGAGIRAYVVDTGILANHTDFGGRVASGYTSITDSNGTTDCNGHGTHVAGTIGGSTWGVAKGVTLVPVRVLDCAGSGSLSTVIAGLDWVIANGIKPAVVNMSLGGGASTSLDSAVAKTTASGYTVVVAAGNSNVDACTSSPAREPSVLTVGATTINDARASYSNYGTCLDLFAPGSSITSTWYSSVTATNTISGTSMAAPHVTGAAVLTLAANASASPAQVANLIKEQATTAVVSSAGFGSANLLLFATPSTAPATDPTNTPSTTTVAISSLTGSSAAQKNNWRATVIVSVKNNSGTTQAGAVVKGSFTAGGSDLTCTTGSNGSCEIKSGLISKRVASTVFSVQGITGTNLSYDAAQNSLSQLKLSAP